MQKIHGYRINIQRHARILIKCRARDPYCTVDELPSVRALKSYPRNDTMGKRAVDKAIEDLARELSPNMLEKYSGHSTNKYVARK